jgi:hypothetical protein
METKYFIDDLEKYKEWQEGKASVFEEIEKELENEALSPCGKYKLTIYKYVTGPNTWTYTEGIVTRLSDNKEIVSVKRNYSSFYHFFFDKYLIAGEDYQGYTVVNLETETSNVYFPEAAFKGHGFCWAAIYGVVNNKLIVEGCYWGGPYEVVIYDFSNPEVLPLTELNRFDVDGYVRVEGDTIIIEQELEYRKSDGKFYNDLSDDEQKTLDNNFPKLSAYKIVPLSIKI